MYSPQPNEALHPNLARLASEYDGIYELMDRGQLTPTQARARIAQLEARDDQGVRWSIDPDTGDFVRKTAFGEMEYDTPPQMGYMTPDAYSFTQNPLTDNPNHRLDLHAVAPQMTPPLQLAGATQHGPSRPGPSAMVGILDRISNLPPKVKLAAGAVLVALLTFLFLGGGQDAETAPAPPPPAPAAPADPNAPAPVDPPAPAPAPVG